QVTDWLECSFDDFFGNTNISSSAIPVKPLGGNSRRNKQQKTKDLSLVPESSKTKGLSRKRAKASAEDLPRNRSRQNWSQSQDEPWVDRYKPETQNDLAVQKKKIEEVETWLKMHIFQRQLKQGGSVLLLTGPSGCGKTATVQILAKDLGVQVQEWTNPVPLDFTKEDLREMLGHNSDLHTFPSQAQGALFQDFLLRANKYNKLQMLGDPSENDKKLILVEDIPNQFCRDPSSLHEILRKFVRTSRCPLIFIISDNFSGDSNQRLLFPKEILEEFCISNISFKPVAPTNMMKVLNRIAATEASMNREKNYAVDRASLELLCRGCSGDIRSAINSLQFSSMKDCSLEKEFWSRKKKCEPAVSKVRKKTKSDTSEDQEIQAIGGKDASIFLFHALGKIIYCK
ncbi:RAD17 protein, partial [Rhynochetos jubatus]|nr:RAD17 protein [Rhynochetos jubatus]